MASPHVHVSIVALPDAVISTLGGIYDVLSSFGAAASVDRAVPDSSPFMVEIVGQSNRQIQLASELPLQPHKGIDQVSRTDIVIVPSLVVSGDTWECGRYRELVEWLKAMHASGAILCSACSGIFLLAETGLFDGTDTTVHWGYAEKFRKSFPRVPVFPERALMASGDRRQFISSGASSSWHDLVLYLVSRHVDPAAAQGVARYFALQWHQEGLAPYVVFSPPRKHGDATILEVQDWLEYHFSVASPVEEMISRSGQAARTFKRRFKRATGYSPLEYVHCLRVEEAKRRLERTNEPVEEIGWRVGYEDPAFFRRLFKRRIGMTPGSFRRKFSLPDYG